MQVIQYKTFIPSLSIIQTATVMTTHHTTMLKQELLKALASIEGLTAEPSTVSGGIALFFRGCEFAHFHNDNELDLRLTKKVIQAQGIAHPTDSTHHPDRSPSSPWIEVRFTNESEVERTAELIKLAIAQLMMATK